MKTLLEKTPGKLFEMLKELATNPSIEATIMFDAALERLSYKITGYNYARAMRVLDKIMENGGHNANFRTRKTPCFIT